MPAHEAFGTLEAFGHSDVGRERSNNEDYLVIDEKSRLFAVCDGMGGHEAGELASQTAGDFIREHVAKGLAKATDENARTVLMRQALEGASERVYALSQKRMNPLVSSLSVAFTPLHVVEPDLDRVTVGFDADLVPLLGA